MDKDISLIIYGLFYCILTIFSWLLFFTTVRLHFSYTPDYQDILYIYAPTGSVAFIGACFLLPGCILYLIFILSKKEVAIGKVAFGFSLPGYLFFTVGPVLGILLRYSYITATIINLICAGLLILFGVLIFAKCFTLNAASPTSSPPTHHYPTLDPSTSLNPSCPYCKNAAIFVSRYQRYFCYECFKYV